MAESVTSEVVAALTPVVAAFDALGVPYRVGGSVASSAYGVPRSTLDVDVACDLRLVHVTPLVAALADAYYIDDAMLRDAVRRRACCNLIHLATMLKVDLFVCQDRAFERTAFTRGERRALDPAPGARVFDLTSAEDVVLHKLEWFVAGGSVSERQWLDLVGVLRVQRATIDVPYMRHWAAVLGVEALFERALGASA